MDPEIKSANLTSVIENAAVTAAEEVGFQVEKEEKGEAADPTKSEASKDSKATTETTKPESKTEATKEEAQDDDLTPEQITAAKNLYKGLADPNSSTIVLEAMAKAAGFNISKEIKEAVKAGGTVKETVFDLKTLLKEGLGEFDFLAEKLGPVLEKALKHYVTENTKDLRQSEAQRRDNETRTVLNQSYGNSFAKYENATELQDDVNKLMTEVPLGKGISFDIYFDRLIKIAAGNRDDFKLIKVTKDAKPTEKQKATNLKNKNDIGAKLTSSSERGEVKSGVRPQGKMNLTASISAAIEELAKK